MQSKLVYAVDRWLEIAFISEGIVFPRINKLGEHESKAIAPNTVYRITVRHCKRLGLEVAPHDLRRTFAQLAYDAGCPLEQIQKELGHASIQTTERYLNIGLNYHKTASDFIGEL